MPVDSQASWSQAATPADVPEITASRLIEAPRDLVFDAFSSPNALANWWGPTGFSLTTHEMSFAPDSVWRFVMHGPDGRDYKNKIVFREIERPERISYVHPGDEGTEPVRNEVTVSFLEDDGKTRLTWRMRFQTIAERDRVDREYDAAQGLGQSLTRLDAYVAESGSRAFVVSRSFDASRELLWKALTEPERMAQWWGPKGFPVAAAKMDFRVGGSYLYGTKTPDGGTMWGRFIYREIETPSRIVLVSSFSDENGGVTRHPMSPTWPLETLSIFSLETDEARARLTIRWLPINAADEERATFAGAVDSMNQGWGGTLDQLAEYLASP
jgi:uncharacterized protein YndB with AHSA1/START domain